MSGVYNPNGSLAVGLKTSPYVFSACFNAIAVSAAQDVFELVTPATKRVVLRKIILGQYSDVGDAASEILSVLLITGHTTSSNGTAVTPVCLSYQGNTAASTVERNGTTIAADGTPVTRYADVFNIAAGWFYSPDDDERLILPASTRLVCRITAPADALTMNGTLIFEEI